MLKNIFIIQSYSNSVFFFKLALAVQLRKIIHIFLLYRETVQIFVPYIANTLHGKIEEEG